MYSSPISGVCTVRFTSLASVNESCNHGPGSEGEALEDGDTLALGDSDNDALAEGLTLGDGETDALALLLGEREALGESEGETLGLPTDATLRISTIPPTLGDALLRVNDPLATVPVASNA